MKLSGKAVKEFQEIYSEEFGTKIDLDTAIELGTNLLKIMKVIYKPITKMKALPLGVMNSQS